MSRRNKISLLLMVAIGLLISWYAVRDIKFSVLINDLSSVNLGWLIVALGCILLYFFFESVVTYILVKSSTPAFSFRDAIRVPLVEQLFNGITPFSSGGQPAQLVVLLQAGVDGGKASSALLMKFVIYQAMIVLNFVVSLIIGFRYLVDTVHSLAIFVVFGFLIHLVVIVALLMVMYWYSMTKKLVNGCFKVVGWFVNENKYQRWKRTLNQKIDNFHDESIRIGHEGKLMVKVCILTFLQLFFYYLIPYFVMLSLGYHNANVVMVTSLDVLIFLVISMFPIPGGAGGAEYSFEKLFRSYIHSSSKLALAMILWRLLTYYLGLFLGLIALMIKPRRVHLQNNEAEKMEE
ncbi:lysylphosphatidylglycerol synthase transmembrane domain-containing protein [Fructilactobacillus cliffordii]|uniref:Phosphatidylglycerol lysyltransferase n=1 Tax=Fructilactobacillus cliffordii TaxID=2940299 RepID=A0A9Q9E0R3_9LACO|nr:lysylphosphatidylglycerol synthase transmembrane domain-containing protein [Fructilactobacillus cliffordii]USS86371.1 flippase-like domain-containing protein [Fructilactobacillus cliffordii]USS89436.1 flippase-like domain-containing protein [Fructilactobacillus cliffordii]